MAKVGSFFFAYLMGTSLAFATGSSGITYHGRLLKPDGSPVLSNAQFRIQVRTPGSENCLMFEELQSKDLSTSNGMFSITINDGGGVRQDSALYTLNQIFANRGTFTFSIADCNAINTYTPGAADGRLLKVFFNDGTFAGWEPMPAQSINFVPMAVEAYSTGGFTAKSLLRVEDGATLGNVSSLTTANFNELMALILGTSSQYTKAGQLNGSSLPAMTSGQTLGWNGSTWSAVTPLTSESDPTVKAFAKSNLPTCSAGQVLKSDGTSFSCVTDADGWTASDATTSAKGIVQISAAGGIDVNAGVIQLSDIGTSGDYYKVHTDAKGRVTSGSTSLVEADIPNLTTAGHVSGNAITSGTIGGSTSMNTTGTIFGNVVGTQNLRIFESTNTYRVNVASPSGLGANYSLVLPTGLPSVTGQVLTSDTSGNLSWSTPGGGGTVTSVTSGGLPIVVGGSAAAPTVSVNAASTSATGVVQLASSSDTSAGLVIQASDTRLTNGRAPTGSASGDLSGTYPGPTVSGISGKPVVYTSIASGQYLKYDGANIVNANIAIGDVTNLSTQLSNKLDASNMPANCAAGSTLTFSSPTGTWACTAIVVGAGNFGSQSANTFLAAPDGSAGAPTFRTIAAADLPASASYWQAATGGINYAGGNVGIGTTTPLSLLSVKDPGSTFTAEKSLASFSYYNGRNLNILGPTIDDQAAPFILQTNNSLNFRIDSIDAMTINDVGRVGIGTTTPGSPLTVNGVIESSSGGIKFPDGTTQTTASAGGGYSGPRAQVFTSSATFTVPAGITSVKVTLIAGGGGAAGCSSLTEYPGGAAGAGVVFVTGLTPGAGISITVGGSGAGCVLNTGCAATSGGSSSFGAYASVSGGTGGKSPNCWYGGGTSAYGANGTLTTTYTSLPFASLALNNLYNKGVAGNGAISPTAGLVFVEF